jgi:hypothetical protein
MLFAELVEHGCGTVIVGVSIWVKNQSQMGDSQVIEAKCPGQLGEFALIICWKPCSEIQPVIVELGSGDGLGEVEVYFIPVFGGVK